MKQIKYRRTAQESMMVLKRIYRGEHEQQLQRGKGMNWNASLPNIAIQHLNKLNNSVKNLDYPSM